MACRVGGDDRCRTHHTPVEHMHFCPNDGPTCGPCSNADCHQVTTEVRRRAHLDPQHRAICHLYPCGKSSPWTDLYGAREWETRHHTEITA